MAQSSPPEERFTGLWRDHADAVLRYARRRVTEEQADEVVAETFMVAWRRLDEVPSPALPWLFGVARRVSANVRRADRRRTALHDRIADETPWTAHAAADSAPPVVSALAQLPDDDRELLMLLAWEGLTRTEAAAALGCSRGALAVRLHRARHRLKTALARSAREETSPAGTRAPADATSGGPR